MLSNRQVINEINIETIKYKTNKVMKKNKLFMMLALLVAGVSGVYSQTYTRIDDTHFTDGTLLFTLGSYQDANNSTISLGNKEVAVSLYLTNSNTDQLTDVINATRSYSWGQYVYTGSPAFTELTNNQKSDLWSLREGSSQTYNGIKYTRLENDRQERHRWKREFSASKIGTNAATSVDIPTTVTYDGEVYDVVAIPYAGFIFPDYYTEQYRDYCDNGGTTVRSHVSTCMRGGNPYLTTVNIPTDSKLKDIGAYAFAGCTKLQSIMIPKTVVEIKEAAFEMCWDLTTVTFQKNTDNLSAALQSIGNYVFYDDKKITSLIFPEGLISIGNYALIYNMALTEIKLPSTLESVGAHFLCDASSLEELTMPASCHFINGAFLHGCESMKSVYMLGYAQFLDLETSESDGQAFDYNHSYCKGHVNNCTFYVPENFLKSYQQHPVWRLIDDKGVAAGSSVSDYYNTKDDGTGYMTNGSHTSYANTLTTLPGTEREFIRGKWVTAIFPKEVKNYKSTDMFGADSKFAEFVGATRGQDEKDPISGKTLRMYNLQFRLITTANIPAKTVGMFCPEYTKTIKLWDKADETLDFTKEMYKPHAVGFTVEGTNGEENAYIYMSGYYVPYRMKEWDFFFSNGQFKRVASNLAVTDRPEAGVCRCFWTVQIQGLPAQAAAFNLFDETTGIGTIKVAVEEPVEEAVYDLSGRKLNATDKLKSGIYIMNGKKVVIK